ncbi:head GIN domain-containing protein [Flavobacterium cerinum]|uniref:DUF2807 domain-containing protein n=1 Tax=Flavobacterium cerinum TaxID=2502784 RepID=A0A444HCP5_9FLAO|nr:head GIN domain-containing protein [Flavobacterium cerinum]RWX01511.1 DUF2807 domain-containing protein [Flavobacterium cerinum]
MKLAALVAVGLFFAQTAISQEKTTLVGNGNLIKETHKVNTTYTKLKVNGPFEVDLVYGEPGTISIEGYENILHLTTMEVTEGTLSISTRNEQPVNPSRGNKIRIKVPYNRMEHVALIGCGSINSRRTLKNENFKATVDGPGTINATIKAENTEVWVLGSGTINICGTSQKFICRIAGSGTVKANGLEAKNVIASVSGAGEAKVNSTKAIKGRIVGSGNIAFSGRPEETDLKFSGSGNFTHD